MTAQGDIAPDFELPDQDGALHRLSTAKPAPVVLFFYPRDDTSGCTREAQDFTALARDFADAGAMVYGISKDTQAKHQKFREKRDLTVTLLSDAEDMVCESYGVWAEKKMYGKTFMGIVRTTVLIDGDGRIARVWPKVKVPGHADEVLQALRELSA
ncbi:alkyl hydroperoxide reductase [Actibacterium mucosum KCTC 23349]|uniref:thioredoxin-dependent peroxiredoxin n=1 Tax=Actibacterium mucosum KCTC 23349 TaxID=1454373 RepID=A0A037ZEC5_9RHOB|nr:peroxiredoxin [Actibacterium mucosum]KAJ54472.1 alkyl hydroperoxide reductase [Actibacterium mucosum KCTC 23349]